MSGELGGVLRKETVVDPGDFLQGFAAAFFPEIGKAVFSDLEFVHSDTGIWNA